MQKELNIKEQIHILDQKGQTLIEFIFLLVVLIGLSLTILKSSNFYLAKQWEIAINSIVRNHPGSNPGLSLTE